MHRNKVIRGRKDMVWLNGDGSEKSQRDKYDYVFVSNRTKQADEMIRKHGFDGNYIKHLSTGHCETENITLAILAMSQRMGKMVGMSLYGLINDPLCRGIIRYSGMRILWEVLEFCHSFFHIYFDENVKIPKYDEEYPYLYGNLNSVKYKFKNQMLKRRAKFIYIELDPKFVSEIGSVNVEYGPLNMRFVRESAKNYKMVNYIYSPKKLERFLDLIPV